LARCNATTRTRGGEADVTAQQVPRAVSRLSGMTGGPCAEWVGGSTGRVPDWSEVPWEARARQETGQAKTGSTGGKGKQQLAPLLDSPGSCWLQPRSACREQESLRSPTLSAAAAGGEIRGSGRASASQSLDSDKRARKRGARRSRIEERRRKECAKLENSVKCPGLGFRSLFCLVKRGWESWLRMHSGGG
jgi:hypothetical protein